MFSNYTQFCINLAKKAGSELKNGFNTKFEINSKSRINDLVTEYDLIAEKVIIEEINKLYPDHSILAEESGLIDNKSEYQWIIDPLDGTVNFANKLGIFSTSIALKYKHEIISACVFNPISYELFFAEIGKGAFLNGEKINASSNNNIKTSFLVTGFPYNVNENPKNCLETFTRIVSNGIPVRRLGSAALDLCFVAAGRFDGYWEVALKPWDMAAGKLILEEAGGKVTHYDGTNHEFKQESIIASNTLIHYQLVGLVNNEN